MKYIYRKHFKTRASCRCTKRTSGLKGNGLYSFKYQRLLHLIHRLSLRSLCHVPRSQDLLVLNVGNGWLAGGCQGMMITSDDWDHFRKFPAFCTSKKKKVGKKQTLPSGNLT